MSLAVGSLGELDLPTLLVPAAQLQRHPGRVVAGVLGFLGADPSAGFR